MNQVTNEQKDRVMKTFAVFGFMALVVFGVWLAVQIVTLMPQAFSSLASIADGVYSYRSVDELTVSTEKSTVNVGETFVVSWDAVTDSGAYTFMYDCHDGVSVDIRDNTGSISTVSCGESITLGGNTTEVAVTVSSERQRFTEIAYTIAFVPTGNTEPSTTSSNMMTVVNASIPAGDVVATDTDEEDTEDTDGTSTDPTPSISDESETPSAPTFIETITYETPVSNPNGYTDLAVRIVAVGHLTESGDFVAGANIDNDARGAFQFEVKNIGTKTSDTWNFDAALTSGVQYEAPEQSSLKPQERVIFTLGFDNVGDDGISIIGVTLHGGDDSVSTNNSFTWAVSVVE